MIQKWKIRYYTTETAYRGGTPSFTETVRGDKSYATAWALNKLSYYRFMFYDMTEQ